MRGLINFDAGGAENEPSGTPRHNRRPSSQGALALAALFLLAAAASAAPVLAAPAYTIQPGDEVFTVAGQCSLNFLFDTPDGALYFGTAAHCAPGALGTYAWGRDVGLVGRVEYVGDYEQATAGGAPVDNGIPGTQLDFALIRVLETEESLARAEVRGQPGVPCGVARAEEAAWGDRLGITGWGLATMSYSWMRENRSGVLFDATPTQWRGVLPSSYGDSGGPVTLGTCKAFGILTGAEGGYVEPASPWKTAPHEYGPTVEAILAEMHALGWPLRVRLADGGWAS